MVDKDTKQLYQLNEDEFYATNFNVGVMIDDLDCGPKEIFKKSGPKCEINENEFNDLIKKLMKIS